MESMMHLVLEQRVDEMRWDLAVAPVARTPQDKKGSRALSRYSRKLQEHLNNLTPWRGAKKKRRLIEQAKQIEKELGI